MRSLLLERFKAVARGANYDQGWGPTGAYGQRYAPESRREFVEAFRDRVWANRCVKLISSSSTQVRLEVRRGKVWTDEHPMLDLLRRPSRRDPAVMFFEWSILWGEIVGDWFWEIVPGVDGQQIGELFPLHSHQVEVKPGPGGPSGYVYDREETGVDVVQFDAVDPFNPSVSGSGDKSVVIAGRWPNPFDDLYGLAPMRAAKDAIISSYYYSRYNQKFFRNSARPDLILAFKKLDEGDWKKNKEAWDDFKGVDNAHRAAIIKGEPVVHEMTRSPRDAEFTEGSRMSREEECAAFGVPPSMVGDTTRMTYNNYENAEPIFWKGTMVPKLWYFASWANAVLLPFFPDIEEFRFNVNEVPAMARAEGWRSERVTKEANEGIITRNEGREALGKEKSDEPGMDEIWVPTRTQPMSKALPGPGGGEEGEPEPPEPEPEPKKELRSWALEAKAEEVDTWLRNALEAKLRFAARARTELTSHFAAQETAILAIFEAEEKQSEVEKKLLEYGWSADDDKFHEVVEAMHTALGEKAFEITATALSDHTASDGLLEQTLKEVANRKDGIGSVTGRVKDEVIEQVREGLQHGLTYRQIAEGGTFTSGVAGEGEVTVKGIQGVYDEYKTWQGERIARTEAAVTFNRTSAALMRDAAITHVDIADGDSDEDCGLANGSRWTLAEYEANPIGHPNCTRIGLPVLEIAAP